MHTAVEFSTKLQALKRAAIEAGGAPLGEAEGGGPSLAEQQQQAFARWMEEADEEIEDERAGVAVSPGSAVGAVAFAARLQRRGVAQEADAPPMTPELMADIINISVEDAVQAAADAPSASSPFGRRRRRRAANGGSPGGASREERRRERLQRLFDANRREAQGEATQAGPDAAGGAASLGLRAAGHAALAVGGRGSGGGGGGGVGEGGGGGDRGSPSRMRAAGHAAVAVGGRSGGATERAGVAAAGRADAAASVPPRPAGKTASAGLFGCCLSKGAAEDVLVPLPQPASETAALARAPSNALVAQSASVGLRVAGHAAVAVGDRGRGGGGGSTDATLPKVRATATKVRVVGQAAVAVNRAASGGGAPDASAASPPVAAPTNV